MMKVGILTIFIQLLKYANSQGCYLPAGPEFSGDLIRVRFNEVDLQSTLDANPQNYRGFVGITAPEASVTIELTQKSVPALPEKLKPADYFNIQYFTNEPRTGLTGFFIQLTNSIDRDGILPGATDDINSVEYQLSCSENANPNFISYYLVRVIFDDLNDNTPLFTKSVYSGTVNELTPIGTTVFQSLSYTDLDDGAFGRGDFAVLPGDGTEFDGSTKFEILTPGTGEVTVKNALDFEVLNQAQRTVYSLNVSISDGGTPKRVSYTTLNLAITDGDDLPPEFVYESCIVDSGVCFNPLYRTSITSGLTIGPITVYPVPAAPGNAARNIQARDQDTMNHTIQFSVLYTVPQGYENRFSVVTTGPSVNPAGTPSYKSVLYTAQLSLISPINRNDPVLLAAGGQLQVVIKAEEQSANKRSESTMILVDMRSYQGEPVLDGNLSPPFTGYIMENANIGSFVVDINLIKPMRLFITDVTGQAKEEDYDLTIEPYTGIFNIDDNGYIKLASNNIDSEIKKYHNFNVTLKKKVDASTQYTVSVRIFIIDVNDNSPIFNSESRSLSIPADDYKDSKVIANVSASDKDVSYSNNRITYQVDSVPDSGNKFYVDKDGILYVQGVVSDGEAYTISVSASDNGTPTNRAAIVITLQVDGKSCCSDLTSSYKLFVLLVLVCLL